MSNALATNDIRSVQVANDVQIVTPMEMIKRGRENKVKLFIDNAIDENKRFYP